MHARRELVDARTFSTQVEDADLGIRHTTVESRLGVRLKEKKKRQHQCNIGGVSVDVLKQ